MICNCWQMSMRSGVWDNPENRVSERYPSRLVFQYGTKPLGVIRHHPRLAFWWAWVFSVSKIQVSWDMWLVLLLHCHFRHRAMLWRHAEMIPCQHLRDLVHRRGCHMHFYPSSRIGRSIVRSLLLHCLKLSLALCEKQCSTLLQIMGRFLEAIIFADWNWTRFSFFMWNQISRDKPQTISIVAWSLFLERRRKITCLLILRRPLRDRDSVQSGTDAG